MKAALEYKGYLGSAEVSVEDNLLVGRLLFIRDVVSYVASTPCELHQAFRDAVDDYLLTCAEAGDEPDVPFKGSFNVRTGGERHRNAAIAASQRGVSLNEWICLAIDASLTAKSATITATHVISNPNGYQDTQQVATSCGPQFSWIGHAVTGVTNTFQH